MNVEEALKIKHQFAEAAKPVLRETLEYEEAREEGRARQWLEVEAGSFAEAAYALLMQRQGELG